MSLLYGERGSLKRVTQLLIPETIICQARFRGGSRSVTTSKMKRFVIIVNGFQPLTIMTKRSILDVAAALDPPLRLSLRKRYPYSELFRPNVGKYGTE